MGDHGIARTVARGMNMDIHGLPRAPVVMPMVTHGLRGLLMVRPWMTTGCHERQWMATDDHGIPMADNGNVMVDRGIARVARGMAVVTRGMAMEDNGIAMGDHGTSMVSPRYAMVRCPVTTPQSCHGMP